MNNSDLINKGIEFINKFKEKIDYTKILRIFYIIDKLIYYEDNNNNNLNIDGILLSWLFHEFDDSERNEFYKQNSLKKENIDYINKIINKIKEIDIYKNENKKNEEEIEEEEEENEEEENNNKNELKFELDLIKDSLILDEIGAFGIAKIFNFQVDENENKNLILDKLNEICLISNIKENLTLNSALKLSNEKINFMIVFLKEIYNELNVTNEEKEKFENFLVETKIKLIEDYKNNLDKRKKNYIENIKKKEENRQNILKNLDEENQNKLEDEIFGKERIKEYEKLEKIEKLNEKKLEKYYEKIKEIFDDKNNESFEENEEDENEEEEEEKNEENEYKKTNKILTKTGLTIKDIFNDDYKN